MALKIKVVVVTMMVEETWKVKEIGISFYYHYVHMMWESLENLGWQTSEKNNALEQRKLKYHYSEHAYQDVAVAREWVTITSCW